jgi:hypothetical protein
MFAQGVDTGEEKKTYNNLESGKKNQDQRKKLIIGGTILSLIIVLVVIIMVATQSEFIATPDEPTPIDDTCYNPMCSVFTTKPEFQQYTFENTDQAYEDEFWADDIFGGPVTEPLLRPNGDLESIVVPNSMVKDLKANWESRGELSGYFVLRNVQFSKTSFDDYWIFANNLDQVGYDLLLSLNNTLAPSEEKKFYNIRQYLNGFIRDIHFTVHDTNFSPLVTEKNRIIYVYEGVYKNGVLETEPA